MNPIELVELLKTDALGRIELLRDADQFCVRRVAGGRVWGSGIVARILMRREARALRACADLRAVPHLLTDARWQGVASTNGMVPPPGRVLSAAFAGWANRHQAQAIEYLIEENRVLKEQLGGKRLRLTDDPRRVFGASQKRRELRQ